MPKKHLLLFDLDGTLIDSSQDLANSVNYVRKHYGLPAVSRETVLGFIGNGQRSLTLRALAEIDGSYDIEEALGLMRTHYSAHLLDCTRTYSGVLETLDRLKDACAFGIVSNKPVAGSRTICDALGLSAYMDVILGGGSTENLKPHPEPILVAMAKTGFLPENTWVIGDNYTDLGAGNAAKCHTVFCTYGFGNPRNETFESSVDEFTGLADLFLIAPKNTAVPERNPVTSQKQG